MFAVASVQDVYADGWLQTPLEGTCIPGETEPARYLHVATSMANGRTTATLLQPVGAKPANEIHADTYAPFLTGEVKLRPSSEPAAVRAELKSRHKRKVESAGAPPGAKVPQKGGMRGERRLVGPDEFTRCWTLRLQLNEQQRELMRLWLTVERAVRNEGIALLTQEGWEHVPPPPPAPGPTETPKGDDGGGDEGSDTESEHSDSEYDVEREGPEPEASPPEAQDEPHRKARNCASSTDGAADAAMATVESLETAESDPGCPKKLYVQRHVALFYDIIARLAATGEQRVQQALAEHQVPLWSLEEVVRELCKDHRKLLKDQRKAAAKEETIPEMHFVKYNADTASLPFGKDGTGCNHGMVSAEAPPGPSAPGGPSGAGAPSVARHHRVTAFWR